VSGIAAQRSGQSARGLGIGNLVVNNGFLSLCLGIGHEKEHERLRLVAFRFASTHTAIVVRADRNGASAFRTNLDR
jgi:hypothetical protein